MCPQLWVNHHFQTASFELISVWLFFCHLNLSPTAKHSKKCKQVYVDCFPYFIDILLPQNHLNFNIKESWCLVMGGRGGGQCAFDAQNPTAKSGSDATVSAQASFPYFREFVNIRDYRWLKIDRAVWGGDQPSEQTAGYKDSWDRVTHNRCVKLWRCQWANIALTSSVWMLTDWNQWAGVS